MTNKPNIVDELRAQLAAFEGRQVELLAARDELSYLALVDRDQKSIKKLAALNEELANIGNQAASAAAALKEAARREAAADDAERAKRRRADAEQAGVLIAEAERLAELMDTGMRDLQRNAIDYQTAMAKVRQLSGSGPTHDAVRALFSRALKPGLTGLPQYADVLQPHERRSVSDVTAIWETQVRNKINAVIEAAKQAA